MVLACVYALSTGGHTYSPDEEGILLASQALAHGDFAIPVDETNDLVTSHRIVDGHAVGLSGFVCECPGPGDNSTPGNGKRIEAGRYRLWTQFGGIKYQSAGYSESTTIACRRISSAVCAFTFFSSFNEM